MNIGDIVYCIDPTGDFLQEDTEYEVTWISPNSTTLSVEGSTVKFKVNRFIHEDDYEGVYEYTYYCYDFEGCCGAYTAHFESAEKPNEKEYDRFMNHEVGTIPMVVAIVNQDQQVKWGPFLLAKGWIAGPVSGSNHNGALHSYILVNKAAPSAVVLEQPQAF